MMSFGWMGVKYMVGGIGGDVNKNEEVMIIKRWISIGACIMSIILLAIMAKYLFVRSSCAEKIVQLELVSRDDCGMEFQRLSFSEYEEYMTLCIKSGVSEWLRGDVVRKCRDDVFLCGCDGVALTGMVFGASVEFDERNDVIDVKIVARSEGLANSVAMCYAENLADWSWRNNRDHLLKSAAQIRRSADRKLNIIRKRELQAMQDRSVVHDSGVLNVEEKLKLSRDDCAKMHNDADRLERQAALSCVGMGLRIVNK